VTLARVRRGWILALLGLVALVGAACSGDHAAEPTVPSVEFEPRLVVVIGPDELSVEAGERSDGVSLDPPSVPAGSVIAVRNADIDDHRIVAGTTIDTGVMRPGDTTTLVMTTEGEIELTDGPVEGTAASDTRAITVTVTPRAER
jgi:hypothetical protein